MKIKKNDQQLQIKTWNSQNSGIDIFSKMEGNFLEKFFKYNISDYFSELMANIFEDVLDKKVCSKNAKSLANQLFIVKKDFIVEQMQQKVQNFYKNRSKSIQLGDLPYAFKLQYCNMLPCPNLIKKDQLIFMDVKIKAEVQKIEELPSLAKKMMESYRNSDSSKFDDGKFDELLENYNQEYFNMFICYYGDTNFHIFRKTHYETYNIKILGKNHKLRIFVFYISRQAMVQTFRTINKIGKLDYINDLVIQFYQMKRQKCRSKKAKNMKAIKPKVDLSGIELNLLKVAGVLSLIAAGFFIIKVGS